MREQTFNISSGSLSIDLYHQLTRKYPPITESDVSVKKDEYTLFLENDSARMESIKLRRQAYSNFVNSI